MPTIQSLHFGYVNKSVLSTCWFEIKMFNESEIPLLHFDYSSQFNDKDRPRIQDSWSYPNFSKIFVLNFTEHPDKKLLACLCFKAQIWIWAPTHLLISFITLSRSRTLLRPSLARSLSQNSHLSAPLPLPVAALMRSPWAVWERSLQATNPYPQAMRCLPLRIHTPSIWPWDCASGGA